MTWHSSSPERLAAAWPELDVRYSLPFASCYVYAPRGAGMVSAGARVLCQRLKESDPSWLPRYARQVVELCARDRRFRELFAREAWLIPVPGCTPALPESTVAYRLAIALHSLGLARGVWPGIARRVAVTKSATATTGERPTVRQHYESFAIGRMPRPPPARIILVDDVITKGRTLFAAAARLRGESSHTDIRAFALVRTMGFRGGVERLLAPCEGYVYWAGGDARREP